MKHFKAFTILLFCFLLLVSCSNAKTYFEEGNYTKTLELLKEKKGLTKDDYLMKIHSYVNLGRTEEARESIMLYLLMTDDTDEREFAVNLYTEMDFPDILNILILKDSDGLKAQILKYISFANLKQYDEAKQLLSDYLASELSIDQFATLLVAHPIDINYTFSFFNAWFNTLAESEKASYFSFFFYFAKSDITEDVAKLCLDLCNKFDEDSYFRNSNVNKALLYKVKGNLCEKLFDTFNAKNYYLESYHLNPNDVEVIDKVK